MTQVEISGDLITVTTETERQRLFKVHRREQRKLRTRHILSRFFTRHRLLPALGALLLAHEIYLGQGRPTIIIVAIAFAFLGLPPFTDMCEDGEHDFESVHGDMRLHLSCTHRCRRCGARSG